MAKNNDKTKKQTITCPYCSSQAEKIISENPDYLEMLGRLIRPDEDNVYLCKNCLRKQIEKGMEAWKEKVELSGGSLCPCGTGSRRCCLYE